MFCTWPNHGWDVVRSPQVLLTCVPIYLRCNNMTHQLHACKSTAYNFFHAVVYAYTKKSHLPNRLSHITIPDLNTWCKMGNVPSKRVAQASESRTPPTFLTLHLSTTMPPPKSTLLPQNEADIQLAISAINATQILHVRRAASAFNVPESTLRDRRARKPAQRDCWPNLKKLT